MERSQLEKMMAIIREIAEKNPPGKDRMNATLLSGQVGSSYYVACVAMTGNEEIATLIYDLLEYTFTELARRLEEKGGDGGSSLYTA